MHQQTHSKPEPTETYPDEEVLDYTKSEDLSVKKDDPDNSESELVIDEKPCEELEVQNLSVPNSVPSQNGNGPHISPKEDLVAPEDLTQNCKTPKLPAESQQQPVFDQHLADYLNYQKMQFYLHNYYQLMNQQMLTQNPPSQIRPEFPFMPESSPGLDIGHLNGQPVKRPAPEPENQDTTPNFKKIKIRKFSELADTSSNGSFNEFRPISAPNIVDSSPILNQKLISSNFPMVQHLIGQDVHAANKPKNNRMFKDEPVPKGYLKFKFNEDCNFMNCGYRNHQSHFHCIR